MILIYLLEKHKNFLMMIDYILELYVIDIPYSKDIKSKFGKMYINNVSGIEYRTFTLKVIEIKMANLKVIFI